ncbi:potassium-transporting ATPase subunit KdpC [Halomonas campaniensis]|uniref:potassium-transporting ATPase subunit KdpC n=1 Tax=Halomonas campaniensis TaxID=213554 RepID=UPI000B535B56|nr:potassium-transporting ATPase subunit KdpC [Halomonas campaniensis]
MNIGIKDPAAINDEEQQAPTFEAKATWGSALRFMVVMAVLLGLVYPLATTTVGGWLFPEQAQGSLVRDADGRVVGSSLVSQTFVSDEYFIGRPSAAGNDAGGVSGSNLAPSNEALRERAQADAQSIAQREGVRVDQIPVDLITASGSGVDPHISLPAAELQVARVAQAREIDEASVTELIGQALENTGWLGSPVVNVLQLNVSLDERFPVATTTSSVPPVE